MTKPREAIIKELNELEHLLRLAYTPEDVTFLVQRAAIAVFDDYATGGPGYFGKIMTVVWDGSPGEYIVYTWNSAGKLSQVPQEGGYISGYTN